MRKVLFIGLLFNVFYGMAVAVLLAMYYRGLIPGMSNGELMWGVLAICGLCSMLFYNELKTKK